VRCALRSVVDASPKHEARRFDHGGGRRGGGDSRRAAPPGRPAIELAWRPGIAGPVDGTAGICRVCLFRKPHPTASGKGRYEHVSSRKPKTRAVRSTRDAAGSETGTGRRRRLATTGPLAHLSEVPRQEINKLVGGAAEVRSLVHDDPIRCRNASVRRMRAYRIVPRRDRTTVLSSEPRSRPGPCLCLHDPCSARRDGQRTRGQHGSAIRSAHVRPQSTQPNVGPPRCALPGYLTQRGACWRWVQLTLVTSPRTPLGLGCPPTGAPPPPAARWSSRCVRRATRPPGQRRYFPSNGASPNRRTTSLVSPLRIRSPCHPCWVRCLPSRFRACRR